MAEQLDAATLQTPEMVINPNFAPRYSDDLLILDTMIQADPTTVRVAINWYQEDPEYISNFMQSWRTKRGEADLSTFFTSDPLLNSLIVLDSLFDYPDLFDWVPGKYGPVQFDPVTESRISQDNGAHTHARNTLLGILSSGYDSKDFAKREATARAKLWAVRLGVYVDRVTERDQAEQEAMLALHAPEDSLQKPVKHASIIKSWLSKISKPKTRS